MLQGTLKILLARAERFKGVLKCANSNKNITRYRHCSLCQFVSKSVSYLLSGDSTDAQDGGWFCCLHGCVEHTEGLCISGWVPKPVTRSSCRRSAALHTSGNRSWSAVHVLLICSIQVLSTTPIKAFEGLQTLKCPSEILPFDKWSKSSGFS